MKLQQLKNMPQTLKGTFRTRYKHVVKIKGTPTYLFLKRTNEKKNFFFSTVRLLNFLADFLTINVNFQQPNLMLKSF